MDDYAIDSELDLSGEVCPYTFIKSKLALEELSPGQVLSVTVDNSESASNVPKSLQQEGHEVLSLERGTKGKWRVVGRHSI